MKTSALAKRGADAQNIISAMAKTIADVMGLPEGIAESLQPQHRDPTVRAMMQQEAVAQFLSFVAKNLETRKKRGG